jgi:hypothetical protein
MKEEQSTIVRLLCVRGRSFLLACCVSSARPTGRDPCVNPTRARNRLQRAPSTFPGRSSSHISCDPYGHAAPFSAHCAACSRNRCPDIGTGVRPSPGLQSQATSGVCICTMIWATERCPFRAGSFSNSQSSRSLEAQFVTQHEQQWRFGIDRQCMFAAIHLEGYPLHRVEPLRCRTLGDAAEI